jgi:hypothetical protein
MNGITFAQTSTAPFALSRIEGLRGLFTRTGKREEADFALRSKSQASSRAYGQSLGGTPWFVD